MPAAFPGLPRQWSTQAGKKVEQNAASFWYLSSRNLHQSISCETAQCGWHKQTSRGHSKIRIQTKMSLPASGDIPSKLVKKTGWTSQSSTEHPHSTLLQVIVTQVQFPQTWGAWAENFGQSWTAFIFEMTFIQTIWKKWYPQIKVFYRQEINGYAHR